MESSSWKRCSTCKNDIGFSTDYYACSVSTCNRKGTDFAFCTVECWEAHVPLLRHRDSWAEERRSRDRAIGDRAEAAAPAPTAPKATFAAPSTPPPSPPREASPPPSSATATDELPPLELRDRGEIPEDILVVASKLKAYIRARSGMNASDGILPAFSRILRDLADDAIARAHEAGRKTVMDRDLP